MREIKFRAWDKKDKLWVAGWSIMQSGQLSETEDKVYMQFTGLKDKNGVEIYEGDIVKYIGQLNPDRYKLFIIEWDDKLAGFYAGGGQIQRTKGYEVIGNIYETPELLDKK